MPKKWKTFYELLFVGQPCRLFFDIEYNKDLNKEQDGEAKMIIFRKYLIEEITKLLGKVSGERQCAQKPSINTFETDASSGTKFSRHVVVQLSGFCFKDIWSAGFFVDKLCEKIRAECKSKNEELKRLLVNTPKQKGNQVFVDLTVYSTIRNFRLVQSAKSKDVCRRHLRV